MSRSDTARCKAPPTREKATLPVQIVIACAHKHKFWYRRPQHLFYSTLGESSLSLAHLGRNLRPNRKDSGVDMLIRGVI
ncbi:hypothetical protein M434DRAFT_265137 [Hypoxylon sp. CO27-5]|nr:hypothetical protein M434DRAFT_265137 [Hypoxylon sp. CO27-5]